MLLRAEQLAKHLGDRVLFEGVGLDVRAGERIGLVGPNGAGKTTLLRLLAGEEAPDAGQVTRAKGARVGRLRQEIDPTLERPVRDEVRSALARLDALEAEIAALEARIAELGRAGREPPASLAERYDRLRSTFVQEGGFDRDARVERVLAGLGFAPEERERPLRAFSGGWLMRVELAKLLLSQPDVLLLDEPTNHLDLAAIEWLETYLDAYRGAVVAVSHDRTFLRQHVHRIAELEQGRLTLYEGNYDRYRSERAARREQLRAEQRNQERRVREIERFVTRFRAKASKARQVQSRLKMLDRMERVELPRESRTAPVLRLPEPPRSGEVVLALEGLHKRYGDHVVYRGIDLVVRRGERVALVGPNGAGKSTLLRILAGALPFDAGTRRLGHNVRLAFYAQHQLEALDPELTVLDELARAARIAEVPRLRAHLGAFLFSGDDVEKRVGVLSGGEKARLALAKLLLRPVNCLCLDEPTNHLDPSAADAVEAALRAYTGTIVFVSHDRSFLDAMATRVVEIAGGELRDHPGGYASYRRHIAAEGESFPAAATAASSDPPPASPGRLRAEARREERARARQRRQAERRLAEAEAQILERERELEALAWELAAPEVHRDGERVRALEGRRAELRAEIDALYRRWTELAEHVEDASPEHAESS